MREFPKWKVLFVVFVCVSAVVLAIPNFVSNLPEFMPSKTVSLGLDLKGGSQLLLEVDFEAYFKEQLDNLLSDIRTSLRTNKISYIKLRVSDNTITFQLLRATDSEQAESVIRKFDSTLKLSFTGKLGAISYSEKTMAEIKNKLIDQSIEIVRRRVDELSLREISLQKQGNSRILLQVPGLQDPEELKKMINTTAKLTFHLVDDTAKEGTRAGIGRIWLPQERAAGKLLIHKRSIVTGDMLVYANATYNQESQPVVSFRFNTQGAKKIGDVTTKNTGKLFAIVLDGKIISAPVIREPILGGSGQISGNFTVASADNLAKLLRAGALPAPLKVIEERTVGPSLGADSIEAGKKASALGVILVMIFMVLAYGIFGVFSNIALIINLVLILASLSIFQATLTLPGIAGIVLTIGMAVDANVLIFERIREEAKHGKSLMASINNGFAQAFKTILDSNITTLIAAILLFYFGSGSVKGFAVTLSIGILSSMFSAIMLSRALIFLWVRASKAKTLPI